MRCRHLCVLIVAIGMGCLASPGVEACDVTLQVNNNSPDIIVALAYRQAASEPWSDNLLSTFVGLNDKRNVTWRGDGNYELGVSFTGAQTPTVVTVQDVCTKTRVIANTSGVHVQ